ncbi:MAG TPA: hypothetical protein DEA08_21705, partial [Planctomycetes bacterium]|nr:hypothetical protein [Planctomycetota bacterium]
MSQDPLVGSVLGGARLIQRVSKGLMAHVYQGHYERLGIPVAVKVLSPKATSQGVNRERFVREGRALAQLSHANIIKIYNVGHENGRFFIIMDWIQDGMNLRQLAQTRPLTPAQSLKVVQRLCEALEYIHQRNLIHRDLKPANILLDGRGGLRLADFGLARLADGLPLTRSQEVLGTPAYMAPEQVDPGRGRPDVRSDVYGLGATLYHALTGRPPFAESGGIAAMFEAVMSAPLIRPSRLVPEVDPELEELCLRCLERDPARRFASAEDLLDALQATSTRAPRSSPALPVLALVVLALGGGAAAFALGGAGGSAPSSPSAPGSAPPKRQETDASGRLALVQRYLAGGNPQAALTILEGILAQPSPPPRAWRALSLARSSLRDLEGAEEAIARATELAPEEPLNWVARCDLATKRGRYREAIEHAERALALGEHSHAYANRGAARFRLGEPERALADFRRALELEPSYYEARLNLIVVLGAV